jgi:serine/threonine-protein kinase
MDRAKLNATAAAPKFCPTCGIRYAGDAIFCPGDGTPLFSTQVGGEGTDVYLGREISGHIEIRELAGVGAMGRVYRAFQKGIERDVAVKILHRELSANPQLVARFHREAKVASRLSHPNVVQVHLAGQLPDGALYIVMEYLDGLSLQSALLASGGQMPLSRALHIALQICDAAGEAHSEGVVHRDLKPDNVMLIRRGDDVDYVKVLDFGIARLNWGDQSMATAAGLIFGTARYISPEGAQGEAVGPSGDVYAIATVLYQMLSGRTPFEGDQAVALLVQQIHDPPPPLQGSAAGKDVPEAIARVVMKNLAKRPADRASDAHALGRMLLDAAKTSGLSPEDLVPRSLLLGSKSGRIQLGADARTDTAPMALPSSSKGRRAGSGFPPSSSLPPTAPMAAHPAVVPTLSPIPRPSSSPPPAEMAAEPRKRTDSNVDQTLDDDDIPELMAALPLAGGGAPDPRGSSPAIRPTASTGTRTEFGEPVVPPEVAAERPAASRPDVPSVVGWPRASVDTALREEDDRLLARRARSRAVGVAVLCLLVGAIATSVLLFKTHLIGPVAEASSLDAQVALAEEAMRHKRWDGPPGDNVRELTSEGLARWPGDPRLTDVRARAAEELVREALGSKFEGDLALALHLARLASQLDPTLATAQHLVEEYELAEKSPAAETSSTSRADASGAPPHAPTTRPSTSASAPSPMAKVAIDAVPSRPHLGEPVAFSAKVANASGAPPKAIEDVRFKLNGPGLSPDTHLTAVADGSSTYRAAFTFFEAGKYELTFEARVDGVLVRTLKPVVAGEEAPAASVSQPLPPPPPSRKWL